VYEELASVRGTVDLSPHEALDSAQTFLEQQGYRIVRREEHSLIAERRPSDQAAGQDAPSVTVETLPQAGGGVRIRVMGNDREGVQERQAAWMEWSESLPKKSEAPRDEPGDQQQTIETAEVPLPPPPRVDRSDVPPPSPPPRRGSSRLLVGTLVGCGALFILGMLFLVALVVGVGIGAGGKAGDGGAASEEGETTNTPKTEEGKSEKYIPVTVRVSGEQGTRYGCVHFDVSEDGETIQEKEEGQLGSTPVEYRARISDSRESSQTFYAGCSISSPDQRGQIKVELLVNGSVVDSGETRPDPPGQRSKASTAVEVTYVPKEGGPDPAKAKSRK